MKRPDFVVIGAMKAGSTTLYEDLYGHRDVYLPDKELGFLLDEQITSPAGRRRYDALFQSARPDQLVGDVSADYAKLPEAEGMAERAVELLGDRLRVVYSVRNPIDRVVSQHHHELSYRTMRDPDIDRAVRTEPKLIASTIVRLVVLTVVAVAIAVMFWPDGIGLLLGLAIFRLIALMMTSITLLKELKES